ncbi:MAG: bifunctional metallophosphatase/5'-nucleotidase, partial [Candidatus Marinimicrobia bacterium]|nr:bifunctional metallophosphatase/5'-nucleotidase [Candidatus Neomarinimicrobiota bacterium]
MKRIQRLAILVIVILLSSCQKETPKIDGLALTLLFSGNTNADSSGSFPQKALIINQLRADSINTLIFDSGNLFFNSEMASSSNQNDMEARANQILELFNEMDITALNIGIDDLLLGEEFILSLKERANFVFISSNIFDSETGKSLFFEFHVRKVAGIKVGIFGLTSDTGNFSPSIEIQDPFKTASIIANILSKVSDLTVALSNMPLEMNMALADSVGSIDLIIGYHDGEISSNPKIVNGIPIYMTGLRDREMGRIDLYLSDMRLGLTDITAKKVEAPNSASFSYVDL